MAFLFYSSFSFGADYQSDARSTLLLTTAKCEMQVYGSLFLVGGKFFKDIKIDSSNLDRNSDADTYKVVEKDSWIECYQEFPRYFA